MAQGLRDYGNTFIFLPVSLQLHFYGVDPLFIVTA